MQPPTSFALAGRSSPPSWKTASTTCWPFMAFPVQHRAKLRSTNPLERLNKEVKRRADVVGIFPGEGSIIRLIGAVLLEQNDEWTTQNRYMQVEPMAELLPPIIEGEITPNDKLRIPTKPDGYSDFKPDGVPNLSRTAFRFEAGQGDGAATGRVEDHVVGSSGQAGYRGL